MEQKPKLKKIQQNPKVPKKKMNIKFILSKENQKQIPLSRQLGVRVMLCEGYFSLCIFLLQ